MNFAKTLSRNEMKNIMAGGDTCYATCNGCAIWINQESDSWEMHMQCSGDTEPSIYDGPGQYGGTVCGGQCGSTPVEA